MCRWPATELGGGGDSEEQGDEEGEEAEHSPLSTPVFSFSSPRT